MWACGASKACRAAHDFISCGAVCALPYICCSSMAEEGEAVVPAKKKRKHQNGVAAMEPLMEAERGGPDAALLEQVRRLARGKAAKGKGLQQAVASGVASLAELAGALTATSPSATQGSSVGSKTEKKETMKERRGSGLEAAVGGAAAGSLAGSLAHVEAVLGLLCEQALGCAGQAGVAAFATLAGSTLLVCLRAGLRQLAATGTEARSLGEVACCTLGAAASSLRLLVSLGAGGSPAEGWTADLPRLLVEICSAAASVAGTVGSGGTVTALEQLKQQSSALMAQHASACLRDNGPGDVSELQQFTRQVGDMVKEGGALERQWAAAAAAGAVLHSCEQAVEAAAAAANVREEAAICPGGSGSVWRAPVDAAALAAVCQQLEPALAAAVAATSQVQAVDARATKEVLGCCYAGLASVMRVRCSSHEAANLLQAAEPRSMLLGSLAGHLQAVLALLPAGTLWKNPSPQPAPQAVVLQLLRFVGACCEVTHHMKPAASPHHISSLAAVVLHLLATVGEVPAVLDPSRPTLPATAAFPAACGRGAAAHVHRAALAALLALVAGCDRQQLTQLLRYAEAALPGAAHAAAAGPGALPLCELALALLEADSTSSQRRVVGQHAERLATALCTFVTSVAYGARWQLRREQGHAASAGSREQVLRLLQQQILAAAPAAAPAAAAPAAAAPVAAPTPVAGEDCTARLALPFPTAAAQEKGRLHAQQGDVAAQAAAEVAALCTALRACESLAARPKHVQLPPPSCTAMVVCITAVWSSYAEAQPSALAPVPAATPAGLPGFGYRLTVASGAELFCQSCHLLTALLRHRQEVGVGALLLHAAAHAPHTWQHCPLPAQALSAAGIVCLLRQHVI